MSVGQKAGFRAGFQGASRRKQLEPQKPSESVLFTFTGDKCHCPKASVDFQKKIPHHAVGWSEAKPTVCRRMVGFASLHLPYIFGGATSRSGIFFSGYRLIITPNPFFKLRRTQRIHSEHNCGTHSQRVKKKVRTSYQSEFFHRQGRF